MHSVGLELLGVNGMSDLVVLTCKESDLLLIPTGEDSAVLGVRDTMGVIGDGDGFLI